ncbi:site-2 protease family protein [Patescibacteria group bacterium]|nr:site-2 protease family protein [Patescibacteria group bacterium]
MEPTVVITLALVIFSIILHEIAHGYVAYWLGDSTAKYAGRMTLNPIPHIDPIGSIIVPGLAFMWGGFLLGWAKPVPINPYNLRYGKWGEALVGLAGPATNLLIAIFSILLIRFGGSTFSSETALSIIGAVAYSNIGLALLNSLPIPPLDGSKMLAAFLPPTLYMQYRGLENLSYSLGPFGLLLVLILIINLISPVLSQATRALFGLLTGVVL